MEWELTKREKFIFNIIIEYYTLHAEPIGSRTLSKKLNTSLSPATLRNIMADLEEKGLLKHPHTSAGRIPTDIGYRYHVDNLLKRYCRKKIKKLGLESLSKIQECEGLMEEVSRRLSSLSKYVGLIIAPKITDRRMKHMDFIVLSSNKILVVFISKTGWVYNKIIEVNESYLQEKLNTITRYINTECVNLTLKEIHKKLIERVSEGKNLYKILSENISIINDEIYKKYTEDLYLQGHANILKHPEFADLEKMGTLFKTLEEKIKLVQLLNKCIYQDGIKVTIGAENEDPSIQNCSVVMSSYCMGDRIKGALGVIGPTRMRYPEIINLVDNVAAIIEKLFATE